MKKIYKEYINILELDIINAQQLINDKTKEIEYKNNKLGEIKLFLIEQEINGMDIKEFRKIMQ
jgi:hypothetical protein